MIHREKQMQANKAVVSNIVSFSITAIDSGNKC